jgi:hypothetical protein
MPPKKKSSSSLSSSSSSSSSTFRQRRSNQKYIDVVNNLPLLPTRRRSLLLLQQQDNNHQNNKRSGKRKKSPSKQTWGRTLKRWFHKAKVPLAAAAGLGLAGYAAYQYMPPSYIEQFLRAAPPVVGPNSNPLTTSGAPYTAMIENLYSDLPVYSMSLDRVIELSLAVTAQAKVFQNFADELLDLEEGDIEEFLDKYHAGLRQLRLASKNLGLFVIKTGSILQWSRELLEKIALRPWTRSDCASYSAQMGVDLKFLSEGVKRAIECLDTFMFHMGQCLELMQQAIALCNMNNPKLAMHRQPLNESYHRLMDIGGVAYELKQFMSQLIGPFSAMATSGFAENVCNYQMNSQLMLANYPARIDTLKRLRDKFKQHIDSHYYS